MTGPNLGVIPTFPWARHLNLILQMVLLGVTLLGICLIYQCLIMRP